MMFGRLGVSNIVFTYNISTYDGFIYDAHHHNTKKICMLTGDTRKYNRSLIFISPN